MLLAASGGAFSVLLALLFEIDSWLLVNGFAGPPAVLWARSASLYIGSGSLVCALCGLHY